MGRILIKKFYFCFFSIFLFSLFIDSAYATITLNWTAPTTNTDGSAIIDLQGYWVYYCSGPSCSPATILAYSNTPNYLASLTNGTYCFVVTAFNGVNESTRSNTVCKTEAGTPDTTAPTITGFTISHASSPYTVYITSLSAFDNSGVTGYLINESATAPAAIAPGWDANVPTSYIFTTDGSKTLYAWARDAAGNVSTSRSASVTIETASTTTIHLPSANDTFIDIDNINNSGSETLNTYTWPKSKVANTILMKLDLSGIPAGAVIQSAMLYLYLLDSDTSSAYPTYNLSLNRIINRTPDLSKATGYTADGINAWTPNTYCYNNVPLGQADITSAYDIRAVDKATGFKGWNATQLISGWLANPSTNMGLMINSDTTKPADTYRTFASSKHANEAYHPYLSVTYSGGSVTCATNPKYKVGAGSMYDFPSIQAAYAGLYSGDLLQIQAGDYSGNLTLNQDKEVTIGGGYTCDFTSNPGYTVIHGTVTINDGSVRAWNLVIK